MDIFDPVFCERIGIPRTYFKRKNKQYRYWFRNLFERIFSILDFKGLPDEWPEDYFKLFLFATGRLCVYNTKRWGTTYSLISALSGFDHYWEYVDVSINDPTYATILKNHKDCEIIKLTPTYQGIFYIIDKYACQLAELTKGIDMGLLNAKTPLTMYARSKAESELIKQIYDSVQEGESLVVYKNKVSDDEIIRRQDAFGVWSQDFTKTYIVDKLLDAYQAILDDFFMVIGIPKQINKKSHVLSQEADFQGLQSQAMVKTWINCLRESFKRVEKKFGLKLEVEHVSDNFSEDGYLSPRQGEGPESDMDSNE